MAAAAGGEELPEGIAVDGKDTYLTNSSITGQSSSATYTFSVWFYYAAPADTVQLFYLKNTSTNAYFEVRINADYNSSQSLDCRFYSGSANQLAFYNSDAIMGQGLDYGWNHLVLSVNNGYSSGDLGAIAYLNDQKVNFTFWGSSGGGHSFNQIWVGTDSNTSRRSVRLAHAYISYSYTDLDVTSNRRNFITSDLKPADGQASLNPLVYLPLTDSSTATTNEGTGGNFTAVGSIDTAGRGPNQFNSVGSLFDGTSHYLNRTASLSGASASQQITGSIQFRTEHDQWDQSELISFNMITDVNNRGIQVNFDGRNGYLQILHTDTSGNYVAVVGQITDSQKIVRGKMYTLSWCGDTTNNSSVYVYLNGEALSGFTPNMSSQNIDFVGGGKVAIGARFDGGSGKHSGSIGEVYLDNTYTNLSTNNIFWDDVNNRGKSVRQVLDETGNTPLIAMPILSNDPGNNLGTGGDFSTQGGSRLGYGARGASEFWSNSFSKPTGSEYLSNTNIGGPSNSQYLTCVFGYRMNGPGGLIGGPITGGGRMRIDNPHNTGYRIAITDNTGYDVVEATYPYFAHDNNWHVMLMSFDMGNTSNRHTYYTNYYGLTYDLLPSYNKYVTSRRFDLSSNLTLYIGRDDATNGAAGSMSFVYLDDSYIDFSQLSNRLKFVDHFGYPKDLTPAIEAGTVTNPLVYLKFDDPSNLGTNSGTGGNFTLTGSPKPGDDIYYE